MALLLPLLQLLLVALGGTICTLQLYLIYSVYIYPYISPLRKVPGPPADSAWVGHAKVIAQSESGVLIREWMKKYGKMIRIRMPFGVEEVVVLDPEILSRVLVSDWMEYPRVSDLSMFRQGNS
jgi:hypothetical protein